MMDTTRIELDGRITAALADSGGGGLIAHAAALAKSMDAGGRGVLVRARLGAGRDAVVFAACSRWLVERPGAKALVIARDEQAVAAATDGLSRFAARAGFSCAAVGRDRDAGDAIVDAAVGALVTVDARVSAGTLDLSPYGLFVIPDLEAVSGGESADQLRRVAAALPEACTLVLVAPAQAGTPPWTPPSGEPLGELTLEDAGETAKAMPAISWRVDAADKARLSAGLLNRDRARPAVVFCNLRASADEAVARLRANGFSVEYVFGNLPRKGAVLDSVIQGRFEALVLTDEGAAGLRGGWARRLINWDLPLEGEPYLRRLAMLDTAAEGAGVVNLVCERYAMGLPAIERATGSALRLSEPDAELLSAPDRSEAAGEGVRTGTRPDAPARQGERGRDSRAGGTGGNRQQEAPRADRRRDGDRRRGERDSRRDDGGRYDGRNARSIQADIAALTGGRLDAIQPVRNGASDGAKKSAAPKGGKPGGNRSGGRNGGRDGDASRARGKPERREPERRARPEGQPRSPAGIQGDPYAVSMEERMRMYRERYGSGADAPEGGSAGSGGRRRRRKRGGSGGASRVGGNRREDTTDEASGPALAPREQEPREQAPRADDKSREGLLGAIRGMFGKTRED